MEATEEMIDRIGAYITIRLRLLNIYHDIKAELQMLDENGIEYQLHYNVDASKYTAITINGIEYSV